MEYDFISIEKKWQKYWAENHTFKTEENTQKPKYYGLTMFPYPSGAGLHVGHPLGYIASDIYARYKRLKGYNVLHPMGYDSFGLPAEQYAIQTGQHPAVTTAQNITRYREQLDKLGFNFDWNREVRTSDPSYYKWTQWIFKLIFNSWYDKDLNKARPIEELISIFNESGNLTVQASNDCKINFSSTQWTSFNEKEKSDILMGYRLAFLANSWVNWCPALGTVLANDEVINGVSERGGYPVEQKLMRQWSMRITAYAERLLNGLVHLEWSEAIKDIQRNWIGKSIGASVNFKVAGSDLSIEVFTTRPDTIYGVSFMVLAPENELVLSIVTNEYRKLVEDYRKQSALRSERDRMADVKNISGQFTGAYVIHPFTNEKIPVWIGDYVLASYGTGAVMAVPCGDQRDWDFAKKFNIPIKNIFADISIEESAFTDKQGKIAESDFLNNLDIPKAIEKAIEAIEAKGLGKAKTNYRLRDAVFSRQRYWGEPFPIYFENEIPKTIEDEFLPIELPSVANYLPTQSGEPPLGNAATWSWCRNMKTIKPNEKQNGVCTWPMELNTMPGWAGSSWYFLRYMDPSNQNDFVSKEKVDYWNQVDLYIGGSEHATGHLLYARFWTKILFDYDLVSFDEPFKKMINQGMILGRSSIIYRHPKEAIFYSLNKTKEIDVIPIHVDINFVENDRLNVAVFKNSREEYQNAHFELEEDGTFLCSSEIEKMSKSKFNVQTPDDLVEKFGADTLRMYEMFLGPLEQAKPWDTKGINGVHNFLRKFWRLIHDAKGEVELNDDMPDSKSLKTLHKTIKKIQDDMDRYVFNTAVSAFMICVNELTEQRCNNRQIMKQLLILMMPYAPHICEEMWEKIGEPAGSISDASFPNYNESYLIENTFEYPISFNGKMRFTVELPTNLSREEIEKEVVESSLTQKYLAGKSPKKIIVVPGKIVNVVV